MGSFLRAAGTLGLGIAAVIPLCGAEGGPCPVHLPESVRIVDCAIARSLEDGVARSDSLHAHLDRLGELKGIVFVSVLPQGPRSGVAAGLSHRISVAGESRILQIALARDYAYGDRLLVTLAHEFRHALEVLEHPEVRTEVDVDALYGRIGFARAQGVVETDAALEMGRVVELELKRAKLARRK